VHANSIDKLVMMCVLFLMKMGGDMGLCAGHQAACRNLIRKRLRETTRLAARVLVKQGPNVLLCMASRTKCHVWGRRD
jgi:hypothetical protein